jgi:F-type H+-transporting ATPase subunit a
LIPKGFQSFLESVVELLRDLVVGILGHHGEKYLPFLGTLFIYIFCMNIAGMIPFMKSPSTSLNITAAMAICVFMLVQFLNFRNHGFLGFLYHLAGSPKTAVEWIIVPLMLPIEIIVQLSRPVTLALRLFGNILGEDILIAAFAVFGISLVASLSPVGVPLQLPFMFLGLLTSLMQALVFTLLSTVYIMLSMPHHDEGHTQKQLEE